MYNFFPWRNSPAVGHDLLIFEALESHSDTPQSIGVLWTGDQPDLGRPLPANTQQLQVTDIPAFGGIRNRNNRKQAGRKHLPYTARLPKSLHIYVCLFVFEAKVHPPPPVGQGILIHEVSRSHITTQHSRYDSSGWVISPTQRPHPDNIQHSQQTDIWDSNPQSQQTSGRRPTPWTARPLGPVLVCLLQFNL
jgi:hypothetical protein